jgi:enterochelin esterase-like enzyme
MDRSLTIPGVRPAAVLIGLLGVWASATVGPALSCPSTAHRLETFSLHAPSLGRSKRILVYLPPGYDCEPSRRYPVFYFNDGHDLFDWNPFASDLDPAVAADIAAREAWYGSWRLDDQLDRAFAEHRLPPLIVVGVASDDGRRSVDLAPVPWSGSGEGLGADYGRFVARTLVPVTDAWFRTIADRRCRGIVGASLGGVSALQIGLAHPDRFAMVLSFSPVVGDPAIARYLAAAWPSAEHPEPSAFLIDLDDDAIGAADLTWLAALIGTAGGIERQATLIRTPSGRHAIASWAERVVPALVRLLGARCSS